MWQRYSEFIGPKSERKVHTVPLLSLLITECAVILHKLEKYSPQTPVSSWRCQSERHYSPSICTFWVVTADNRWFIRQKSGLIDREESGGSSWANGSSGEMFQSGPLRNQLNWSCSITCLPSWVLFNRALLQSYNKSFNSMALVNTLIVNAGH